MKTSLSRSPLLAASLASALLCGCEWTSSSGGSSWSSSYDNMNFSGTYRSSTVTTSTESISSTDESGTTKTTKHTDQINFSGLSGQRDFSGNFEKIGSGTLDVDSVAITFSGDSSEGFTSSGGSLSSNKGGTGTVSGTGWSVHTGAKVSGSVVVTVSYKVTSTVSSSVSNLADTETKTTTITAVTVSQSGQNLTMRFNNGVQMSGKFTAVNQTGTADNGGYDTYNAQFEVKNGSVSKFVGTLNYDGTTGYRMLDGSWTWGRNTYDIHGVGPSWR